MGRSLTKLHEKGGPPPDDVLARVTPVEELVDADLLIEAIVEHAETKKELFRAADAAMSAGGGARLEHVLDPDHGAGRRHDTAREA